MTYKFTLVLALGLLGSTYNTHSMNQASQQAKREAARERARELSRRMNATTDNNPIPNIPAALQNYTLQQKLKDLPTCVSKPNQ